MDLAEPPAPVSAATVDDQSPAEAAHVEPAAPKKAPSVQSVTAGPAVTVDDPMEHAPRSKIEEKRDLGEQITVAMLRGTSGADFEGKCAVLQGAKKKSKLLKVLTLGERDFVSFGEVERHVVILGDNCFIFSDKDDPAPLYVIPLDDKKAMKEDPKKPRATSLTVSPTFGNVAKANLHTILLVYPDGKIAFQFTFPDERDGRTAEQFLRVVNGRGKKGGKSKTQSVVHAEKV